MGQTIKIGVVIADEQEYRPVRELTERMDASVRELYGDELTVIPMQKNGKMIEIFFVLCGIGKVNAAAAAAFLVAQGISYMISSGLSGGLSGIGRNDVTIGSRYIEHDFDLTPLGFAPAEKPQEQYIYNADERLAEIFKEVCPHALTGVMVSGDCFVSGEEKKKMLTEAFAAMSCDMESAAVASVCFKAGVPFVAVRRISDDAGEDAVASYREMNDKAEPNLIEIVMEGIGRIV